MSRKNQDGKCLRPNRASSKLLHGRKKTDDLAAKVMKLVVATSGRKLLPKVGPLRVGVAFSGLDVMSLALEKAGIDNVLEFIAESDRKAREIAVCRFKPRFAFTDIRTIPVNGVPRCHLVQSSAPCPKFSSGGKGEGEMADEGILCLHACKVIILSKPWAFIEEQVKGFMFKKHERLRRATSKIYKSAGYKLKEIILNTKEVGGVPQSRNRWFRVGIHEDCFRRFHSRKFCWPTRIRSIPFSQMFDATIVGQHLLPPLGTSDDRCQVLVKRCVAEALRKDPLIDLDCLETSWLCDIGCSLTHFSAMQLCHPCQTSTRAAGRDFWCLALKRRISFEESWGFQGLNFANDYADAVKEVGNVGEAKLLRMLGNSISLGVLERLMGSVLWKAGLVDLEIPDRWTADAEFALFGRSRCFQNSVTPF